MKNNEVPLPKNDGKHRKWLYEIELLYANFELHRPAFMTLEPIRWGYKFCCEAEKWWVFWTVQQQHCYLWKNSAKWTALTLGKISTKLMRSGAIWRYLWIKKFATWRKIPEPGNTLKDEALFTAKFQNKSTKPYDATN